MPLTELTVVVVLTGIIIVFAILFILTLVTNIYGRIINILKSNFIKKKEAENKVLQTNIKKDNSPQSLDEEIVAVITAAVQTSNIFPNTKYKIKSISSSPYSENINSPSPWKLAGLLENTNIYKF